MDLARVGRFERQLRALAREPDVALPWRTPVLRALGGGPASLASTGVVELGGVLPEHEARDLGERVRAIVAAGLPAVAAFAAPWVQSALSRLVGAVHTVLPAHEPLEDGWVHHVPAGDGYAGWGLHRDVYEDVRDASGEPSLVGAWLALGDATLDNGCMRFVPLDRDPDLLAGRPLGSETLESIEIAAPIRAGDALLWYSHVLHRGGPSSSRAAAPRTSLSLALGRPDARPAIRRLVLGAGEDERLAALASLVSKYGDIEARLGDDAKDWARAAAPLVR